MNIIFLLLYVFIDNSLCQEKDIENKKLEIISGKFIDNITPSSLSIFKGSIVLNWTKNLGDSTENMRKFIFRDSVSNVRYIPQCGFKYIPHLKELFSEYKKQKSQSQILRGSGLNFFL